MNRTLLSLAAVLSLVGCARNDEPKASSTPAPSASASAPPVPIPSDLVPPTPPPLVDASAIAPWFADAGLTAREESDLAGALQHFDAPCASTAATLSECLTQHRACSTCELAARYVAMGIREGWPRQYVQMTYQARFDPNAVQNLPADGSPTKGPADAPIQIVEFGSYLCPHCAAEAPRLDALVKAHPKDIRLVFKPAWSPTNAQSVKASRAALAAGEQGKFWEMHALLFANQPKFGDADLDGYAASLGLDLNKLHADESGHKVVDQMARDMALAEAVKLDGLPGIWINGRTYYTFEDLEKRMGFELQMAAATKAKK